MIACQIISRSCRAISAYSTFQHIVILETYSSNIDYFVSSETFQRGLNSPFPPPSFIINKRCSCFHNTYHTNNIYYATTHSRYPYDGIVKEKNKNCCIIHGNFWRWKKNSSSIFSTFNLHCSFKINFNRIRYLVPLNFLIR